MFCLVFHLASIIASTPLFELSDRCFLQQYSQYFSFYFGKQENRFHSTAEIYSQKYVISNYRQFSIFLFRLKRQLGVLHFPNLSLSLDQDKNIFSFEFLMQFEDHNSNVPEIFKTYHCWIKTMSESTRIKSAWHGSLNCTLGSKGTCEALLQTAKSVSKKFKAKSV